MSDPRARYFTPAEANALLPEVRELVDRGRTIVGELDRIEGPDRSRLKSEALKLVRRLEDLGVEVKGFQQGLVDFPAMRNGLEVWLSWQADEPEVNHWHPVHEGFATRRALAGDRANWEWCN